LLENFQVRSPPCYGQIIKAAIEIFQRVFDPSAFVMSLRRLKNLEDRLRRRRIAFILTPRLRDRENPLEWYNGEQFKERFHMFKETAQFVISLVLPQISKSVKRGASIPAHLQVLAVLRFYEIYILYFILFIFHLFINYLVYIFSNLCII